MNQNFWDERYGKAEYAYGEEPNNYLKTQLSLFLPEKILFPAEGEGRNAVFAAQSGWTVEAFDMSVEGQKKALQLAATKNVSIHYQVGEFQNVHYAPETFDAIALIYAHFPGDKKLEYFKTLATYLKKGGVIILEMFSKKHLEYRNANPKVGGPQELEMLVSKEEIQSAFPNYEILELEEKEVELSEGSFHIGKGCVIRFTGRKK